MAKQWGKNENIVEKTKENLGRGIKNATAFAINSLKKASDTVNNFNKNIAKSYDGMFNPNNKNKTNHKIPTNPNKNKGDFGKMVNNVVGGAQKFLNDKIAPWLATEGSIEAKVTDTINAQGMDAAIKGVQNDCLKNPNSKQCKVGTRTINNRIEQNKLRGRF